MSCQQMIYLHYRLDMVKTMSSPFCASVLLTISGSYPGAKKGHTTVLLQCFYIDQWLERAGVLQWLERAGVLQWLERAGVLGEVAGNEAPGRI
jgi:hypothetical protein